MRSRGVFATAELPEQFASVTVTVSISRTTLNALLRRAHLTSIETDLIRRIVYHHEEVREAGRVVGLSGDRAVRMYEKVRALLMDAAEDDRGDILECYVEDVARHRPPRKRKHCPDGQERCRTDGVCQMQAGRDAVVRYFGVED